MLSRCHLTRCVPFLTGLIACLAVSSARGQGCQISPETATAIALSAEQQAEVARCAQENAANLGSPEHDKRKNARLLLLRPLDNPQVSTAFRINYAKALEATLTTVAENPDDVIAVNALIVAGELSTESSVGMLLQHLDSARPGLRYEASYGLRRAFIALQRSQAAVEPQRVGAVTAALRDRLANEKDGHVVNAHVAALLEAARLPSSAFPQARSQAVAALCSGVSASLKAAGGGAADVGMLESYHKSVRGVRDVLAQPNAAISTEAALAAAELGGRAVAYAVRVVNGHGLSSASPAAREQIASTLGASETLIQLSASLLVPGTSIPAPGLASMLRESNAAQATFIIQAERLVGNEGVLTRPPFSFSKTHFLP